MESQPNAGPREASVTRTNFYPYFSFRAECPHDLNAFIAAVSATVRTVIVTRVECDAPFNEPHVEISTDVSLDRLRGIMRGIPDSHVMLQTLRAGPLSENSLERDYALE